MPQNNRTIRHKRKQVLARGQLQDLPSFHFVPEGFNWKVCSISFQRTFTQALDLCHIPSESRIFGTNQLQILAVIANKKLVNVPPIVLQPQYLELSIVKLTVLPLASGPATIQTNRLPHYTEGLVFLSIPSCWLTYMVREPGEESQAFVHRYPSDSGHGVPPTPVSPCLLYRIKNTSCYYWRIVLFHFIHPTDKPQKTGYLDRQGNSQQLSTVGFIQVKS
ncbi:UNVERIFIED_CONTAM: hypothetical protein K2H54_051434 [Gekko kuhli]